MLHTVSAHSIDVNLPVNVDTHSYSHRIAISRRIIDQFQLVDRWSNHGKVNRYFSNSPMSIKWRSTRECYQIFYGDKVNVELIM